MEDFVDHHRQKPRTHRRVQVDFTGILAARSTLCITAQACRTTLQKMRCAKDCFFEFQCVIALSSEPAGALEYMLVIYDGTLSVSIAVVET
jgi:hypothetical protein